MQISSFVDEFHACSERSDVGLPSYRRFPCVASYRGEGCGLLLLSTNSTLAANGAMAAYPAIGTFR